MSIKLCENHVEACSLGCTGGGCVCPAGQVIDNEAIQCIHPSQCPINCSIINSLTQNVKVGKLDMRGSLISSNMLPDMIQRST